MKRDSENRSVFISLLFKLQKVKPIGNVASKFLSSYERVWNTLAITERSAMDAILAGVNDEKEFDLAGGNIADRLKEFIGPKDTVLDVGCGIGRIEKHLSRYCAQIHGVDVSKRMVKLARKRLKGLDNIYIYKNNGRDLSMFPDNKFDFAFSILVFQHLDKEDAVYYLLEIYRVLKPGAKLYFNVPNFLNDENFKLTFIDKYVKNPSSRTAIKMRYYCPEEVQKILTSIGFQKISLTTNTDIEVLARKLL